MGFNKTPGTDSFRGPDLWRRWEGQVGKRKDGASSGGQAAGWREAFVSFYFV